MRPFLVTELQAGKLPRWALLLLCALYVLPGFIGRDPWRVDDAAGFGVALTMARGGWLDWLVPNIVGVDISEGGPLPFWLAGGVAWLFSGWIPEHVVVRAVAVAGLALLLLAMWYATYSLARRPGVQPSDPFGASATPVDFGRVIADSALLILLGTLGLIARLHETTVDAAQTTWVALFLFGMAWSLRWATRAAVIIGVAIAATVLTKGLPLAAAMVVIVLVLPVFSQPFRLNARRTLPVALGTALLLSLPWPLALLTVNEQSATHLVHWLEWNQQLVAGPQAYSLLYYLRTAPWFFWPAWPIAAWAVWRWRGRFDEPAVGMPMAAIVMMGLVALASPRGGEGQLMPLVPALAMLAATGLPTLRRGVVSLVDWFSVVTYTLLGFAVWVYWLALVTGFPARMAFRASQLAPGFSLGWIVDEIVLGLIATVAWLALVRWRISRQPPVLWRPVVLSCAGLVLAWFLLMTLWLPVFNERNTYRDVALGAQAALKNSTECIETRYLGNAQRASLHYFGSLRFSRSGEQCPLLLIQDNGPIARAIDPQEAGWTLLWQGSRRNNADERFRLYRRKG